MSQAEKVWELNEGMNRWAQVKRDYMAKVVCVFCMYVDHQTLVLES